ncbi:MAG: hypothetical protein HKN00_05865 [Flavobacteriaceae bacterium]|nr:hypothetical protein [Bacteroidia bacterium]NNF74690.1 hypothetical protein [Flavobacteriaceae bacterium]NNK73344.1 hypothetical protein [Flavobacteriaceae bacterium]
MKKSRELIVLFIAFATLTFNSCRDEEVEFVQAPTEETLSASSQVATLMQRTATNDGSFDNIVDGANCISLEFPFTVTVNGIMFTVTSEADLETVEDIIDEFEDDDDSIIINYPITIILSDFTEILINSEDELEDLAEDCNGENEYDDDIECLDFQYPITASIFNTNNELIDTVTITSDEELYNFIDDLDESDIVVVDFPLTVILFDGSSLIVNNLSELEALIEDAEDDCDEDDDFDYNDDDCDSCTTDELSSILTSCSDWIVDKLERNDMDLEDQYTGYLFNFFNDGTISVDTGSNTYPGTWTSAGSGNNIVVTIDIPALPDCNDAWLLHEIEQGAETDVDLRLGDDRLRFETDCL